MGRLSRNRPSGVWGCQEGVQAGSKHKTKRLGSGKDVCTVLPEMCPCWELCRALSSTALKCNHLVREPETHSLSETYFLPENRLSSPPAYDYFLDSIPSHAAQLGF